MRELSDPRYIEYDPGQFIIWGYFSSDYIFSILFADDNTRKIYGAANHKFDDLVVDEEETSKIKNTLRKMDKYIDDTISKYLNKGLSFKNIMKKFSAS